MWPDQRIQELFGIELPIIQAPMSGSSGVEMAAAVSNAGGLGALACAAMDTTEIEDAVEGMRTNSNRPFNVNFFVHTPPEPDPALDQAWLDRLAPYYSELGITPPVELFVGSILPFDEDRCLLMEKARPAVVSFHFGLPEPALVERLKAVGSKIVSSATTVAEARWLEEKGCDAIIAQGYEAGGHRGMFLSDDIATQTGAFSLILQIADAVGVPVIAAGGIADGRGAAAAFVLGASAVQVGTAYLFTDEATIPDIYRNTITNADGLHTALTNVVSGRPSRCLINRSIQELGPIAPETATFPKGFHAMSELKKASEAENNRDFSAHYSGQSVGLGRAMSAERLTRTLAKETLERLKEMAAV